MSVARTTPLSRRLILLTAAALIPLGAMAGIGLLALARDQARHAERAALEIARALSTAVDAELSRTTAVLEAIATATLLERDELRAYHELARRVAATRSHWVSILVHDRAGSIVVDTGRPYGEVPLPTAEPRSLELVLQGRQPVVGSLARGAKAGHAFPVRVPVLRDGEPRYVVSAVVRPEAVLEVVRRQKLPETWVVSVFDGQRQRVARSRQHAESLGGKPSPSLEHMMDAGGLEGAGVTEALEGDRIYTAFSRSGRTGWTVAIGIPAAYVEAGVWGSLAAYGGGLLLSLALGALAALLVARSISRPIEELRAAAQALGRREPPVAPSTTLREIRQVADSIATASAERERGEAEREQLLQRAEAARAIAEAANRSKDEFLAMLGHELRNPLGAIANASQVLANPRTDEATAASAKAIIARQVAHLGRMTDDLLDAARAMTGKIVLQRRPLDLAQAAAQLAASYGARHRIVTRLEPAWAHADATRVEQILGNLLGNAVKYTPPGGSITLSVVREGDEAVMRVTDDGAGMPAELIGRVFEPFVQGDRGLDRAHGGLGIGLTLVRRLAELHGGTASAQSDGPGRGSTFTVRLPAIEPPAGSAAGRREGPAGPPREVLVVEDNDDVRAMLRGVLELGGHRVREARDGLEAMEAMRASLPEYALIDIGMPGIDGYEVARRVRGMRDVRQPVLVAVTGYGLPEDRERARAAGFDFHVVKPVDTQVLMQVLARSR